MCVSSNFAPVSFALCTSDEYWPHQQCADIDRVIVDTNANVGVIIFCVLFAVDRTTCSYLGVESIFNDQNYYVNMQDCTNGTTTMSFNLSDHSKFEFVLFKPDIMSAPQVPETGEDGEPLEAPPAEDISGPIRVPPSWVMRLHITEDQFRRRRPNGQKITNYKGCKLEQYSEYIKEDGLVMRLTIYDDKEENKGVAQVREVYANRKDKLVERYYYPRTSKVHERFLEGCINSLKEHIFYEDAARRNCFTMNFYSEARVDGLIERVDTGSTLTETYGPRDDGVTFVTAIFDEHNVVDGWRKILCMKKKV